jgi:hypothetical protein
MPVAFYMDYMQQFGKRRLRAGQPLPRLWMGMWVQ